MIFHENHLLADDLHETSYLIFSKIRKDVEKLTSAAVVIGALMVFFFNIPSECQTVWIQIWPDILLGLICIAVAGNKLTLN